MMASIVRETEHQMRHGPGAGGESSGGRAKSVCGGDDLRVHGALLPRTWT